MKKIALFIIAEFMVFHPVEAQQTDKLIVHFAFNKSVITETTKFQLDSLLTDNMDRFRITRIELYAHCDSIGNHHYNDSLSSERAVAIKKYLLAKGIEEGSFTKVVGEGKRQPLNQNRTEEDRFLNRRVELLAYKEPIVSNKEEKKLSAIIADTGTKEGSRIILRNLNFQGGRHVLVARSELILDELVEAMHDNPKLKIEIEGHVCCTLSDQDGQDIDLGTFDLSWQRAKAIYYYLIERKVTADRMSYKGFGGSRKIFPYERTSYEQEENRRVEIKIVSK